MSKDSGSVGRVDVNVGESVSVGVIEMGVAEGDDGGGSLDDGM
jgi:hypothetical protein